MRHPLLLVFATALMLVSCDRQGHIAKRQNVFLPALTLWQQDVVPFYERIIVGSDTIWLVEHDTPDKSRLTEADYEDVAAMLGIEKALIKAIVEVETGSVGRGFNDDLTPVIYFDIMVYETMAARHDIDLDQYKESHPLVFERPDPERFGSPQKAQHARLREALSIDSLSAIEATFWGMFQIGGFNWDRCGAQSQTHFVELMSQSERSQLDMFANFLKNSELLELLKAKDWDAFARGYNGPGYTKHNYDTRLAEAYERFKNQ